VALKCRAVVSFKGGQTGFEQLTPGNDDNVPPGRDPVSTENLSYQSLGSISLDGPTELPGSRYAQACHFEPAGHDEKRAVTPAKTGSTLVDLLEFTAAPDPLAGSEATGPCQLRLLFTTDGQAFTSLRPASLKNQSTVFGTHPDEETVRALSPSGVRLERSFALHRLTLLSAIESSDTSEGFLDVSIMVDPRCAWFVSETACFVLQSASFISRFPGRSTACPFGLFPEFSTPVEKTVENHNICRWRTPIARSCEVSKEAKPLGCLETGK
jgi:hypothetical protein